MKQNKRELVVLLLIIVVCWLFSRFLYENNIKQTLPRLGWHFINFSWFLIIMVLGYIGLMKNVNTWKKKFWVLVHIIVLLFLITGGLIEKMSNKVITIEWIDLFGLTRSFFTSPMPFLIIWLLPSILKLNGNKNSVS
ncbi:MAG: hypothetical protein JST94_08530 [Bacteroidetes bacterium]|nr:hypothetical protein [Bacteroidota bacterium]